MIFFLYLLLTFLSQWVEIPTSKSWVEIPCIKGYIVPPLGPTYIGESAKKYGLKVRCLYGEHVREHIVNLGNIVRTH